MPDLQVVYGAHDSVVELVDILRYCAEGISLDFEGWGNRHTRGPGLYFTVISDHDYHSFADPMGANTWPIDDCRQVRADDQFYDTASTVAVENDGAVIVSVDGYIQRQMVRLRDLNPEGTADGAAVEYEDWMGSRHMSAIETSVRDSVVATVTLSEETGRVSTFEDGTVHTEQRSELGGRWQEIN
ncbi:diadenylate cyclase (plasmid) [Halobacterium sp. NMX12-1]|uniref:Diadenylate cyclase n=1 Tax=Halobacterium sp. NMX12-1 TaxID=3166650 RepID=A0AAU8C8V1_9EURY